MKPSPPSDLETLRRRQLSAGWWSLLVFLLLGIALEALHGLKVGAYLTPSNSTRRLLWTLAHAHGTLLALVQIAFALSLPVLPRLDGVNAKLASRLLQISSGLIPAGFFLGGIWTHGGDPGIGIVLVPVGALMLAVAVALIARASGRAK
jgi:hypothetical protein